MKGTAYPEVVITGMGALSPFGVGAATLVENLKAGKSGIRKVTSFDVSDLPVKIAGEIPDFDPLNHLERKESGRMDRFCQFAVIAADEALKQAFGEDTKHGLEKIEMLVYSQYR